MAEPKSAFYNRTTPCPACGIRITQPDFKTGMYVEEEREADQHVTRYHWIHSDIPPLHPPYYALAHCPECAFTDFREDFFEPERSRDNRARSLASRLKSEAMRRGSLIWILRQGGRPSTLDFADALRLHLLAIAIQRLLPDDRCDHLKIARLYLRTAWLHREKGEIAPSSSPESAGLEALDDFAARYRELRESADRLVAACAGQTGSPVAALVTQVEVLGRWYADLRARLLSPEKKEANPLDFLAVARGEWPEIPTDEGSCLAAAVQAFEEVYQRGGGDGLALLKLMSELNYRLGRFDRVLEYAATMSKTGYEDRAQLQRQLTDRSLASEERNRLTARLNRINSALQLAGEIRKEALARQGARSAA